MIIGLLILSIEKNIAPNLSFKGKLRKFSTLGPSDIYIEFPNSSLAKSNAFWYYWDNLTRRISPGCHRAAPYFIIFRLGHKFLFIAGSEKHAGLESCLRDDW
jgi:hypothetical protein